MNYKLFFSLQTLMAEPLEAGGWALRHQTPTPGNQTGTISEQTNRKVTTKLNLKENVKPKVNPKVNEPKCTKVSQCEMNPCPKGQSVSRSNCPCPKGQSVSRSECQTMACTQCESQPEVRATVAPPGVTVQSSTTVAPSGVTVENLNVEACTEVPPSVILGHVHQGHEAFSNFSRGRFCLPAALVAIHTFQNIHNPRANDVDVVLSEGDLLYEKVVEMQEEQRGTFNQSFLSFSDLPKEMETSNEKFTIDLTDSDVLLGDCLSKAITNVSLSEAVEECFKTRNAALVIVGDLAFSVFLNGNGQFCYFDSHSRNRKGEQCRDGTAILMSFPTLHQLQLQLYRLVKSLGSSQCFTRYELQPLQVHRKDNTDAVARMPIPTSHVVNEESQIHDTQESPILDFKISDHVNASVGTKVHENTTPTPHFNTFSVPFELDGSEKHDQVMSDQPFEGLSKTILANSHRLQCSNEVEECDPLHVIQGSISQADSCFAQYKNTKLSLSNVLTSLTCLQKVHEIETYDVNNVLLEGARLHDKTHSKAFPRDLEKAIPQVLSGTNGKYSAHEIETFEGVLKNGRSSRTRTSVVDGLHKAFTRSEMLIISLGNYMLSSFKSCDGRYIVFNPNPCNEQGLPVDNGKATVAVCISVEEVAQLIEEVANKLKKKLVCYKVMSLTIVENSDSNADLSECSLLSDLNEFNADCEQSKFDHREYIKQYMRKRTQKSHIRDSEREYIKKRRMNAEIQQREIEYIKKRQMDPYKLMSLTIVENSDSNADLSECPLLSDSNECNADCEQSKFDRREYMKQYMRKRRQENRICDSEREYIKKRRMDAEIQQNEREYIKRRRLKSEFQQNEREYVTKRRLDSELVAKERQTRVHRYKCNETSRSQEVKRSIGKYATCKTFRNKVKKYSSTKYRQIPGFREKVKRYSSTKYRQVPEFRDKVKRYSSTKYQQNLQFRAAVKQYSSAKYRRCPLFRAKINMAKKVKYHNISAFRDNHKRTVRLNHMKTRSDPNVHKRLKEMMRRQYLKNIVARRLKALQRKKEIQQHRKDMVYLKKDFEVAVQEYPEYVCSVCHRLLFRKQVVKCNTAKYETSSSKTRLARTCINDNMLNKSNDSSVQRKSRADMYICHTCDRYLSSGKMPEEACANRLQLQPIPPELQSLNILEKHLISRMVPFMKVITLPKGGQKKLKGPCVLVPSNLQETLNVLPRCDAETPQIIKLKMKRKLSYKGYYEYCHVNMQKVHEALRCLKYELENLHYRDIDIDDSNHLTSEEREGSDVENPDSSDIDDQVDPQKQQSLESVNIESVVDEDHDNVEDEAVRGGPVLDTFLMPVDMVQESLPFCPDSILSIAPCEGNKPTNIFADKTCEALAFPNHFPDGQNTITEQRPLALSPSKYFQARLMNVDPRFARDPQYIFYGLYTTEVKFISSNISIALRKGKKRTKDGKRITAGTLSQRKGIDHVTGEDTGFRHFPTLKGSPDYWRQTQHDLFAMIRQLGIPTFFCTFSCNNDWPEIVTAIKAQQGETVDVTTLSWEEKCKILASNQVTCARMFDHRVKLFLNTVIRSPAAPIGNVIDWFYRVEWQARGSPHIHCLFWVKDAPMLGRDTDLAVCDFVDQFISCKVPPEEVALHNKVDRFQHHSKHHTKSCKKGNSPCRFNYPRPVAKTTFVSRPVSKTDEHAPSNAEIEHARNQLSSVRDMLNGDLENDNISVDELLEKAGMTWATYRKFFDIVTKKVTVVMKRDLKDCWINNYSPDLLDIWNANMDIQYITDPYSCVMYILSYISKAEHELSDILRHAQHELRQGNVDLKSEMKKLGNVYLDYREVSCQEAAHRMCNLHLKECSRAVVNLPVGENATRMSLPLAQIEAKAKADENDDDIWFKSLVDRYQARPDGEEFDNLCLAQFASEFRIIYGQTKSPNVFTLKDNFGIIQRRQTNSFAVIRYPRYSKTTKPEQFYQGQLKVYLPWRHTCQLKPVGYTTYEEFYDKGAVRLSEAQEIKPVKMIVSENKVTYEKDAEVLHDAWEMLQSCENLEDAWASVANQAEISRLEAEEENAAFDQCNDEPLTDDHNYLDQEPRDQVPTGLAIDHSDDGCITRVVRPLLKCMNKRQQQVFYTVRKWCHDKANGLNPEPFKIFLSGAAGVGKSLLIKCIHYEATKILLQHQSNQNLQPVFLTATTGLAAFNVDGFTIHSLLKIIKPRKGAYLPLGENVLNTMNTKLGEMKILVIDEVSMMGSQILEYVHKRLGQLKHNKELFGGICILAVGDFYQLPPVKAGSPICVPNKCDLWMENFKCVDLTEIMRQRDDAVFAALLNRLRVKERNESLTACDTEKLLGRLTSHENCPHDALFIYAKNKEVDQHNEDMLLKKCRDISEIVAVDVVRNRTTGRLEERPALKANQKSGSLPGRLRIAVGARVMVTKNVDTEHGITNGALGTVTAILPADQDKPLRKGVCIQFDNEKVGRGLTESNPNSTIPRGSVKLMPYEEAMDPVEQERKGGIRRQFPLKLAWACTIHKVQGLTVDKIVISMKSMFESGHAYVAFSRVTNMEGLYLLDFDADKIYRNEGVAQGLVKMEPLQLPNPLDCSHDGFTIVQHNVEGLHQNFENQANHFQMFTSDVVLLTETWLSSEEDLSKFQHKDFHMDCKSRRESYDIQSMASLAKGGVAVYVKKGVHHGFADFTVRNIEFLSILVCTAEKPVMISVVYRPTRYTTSLFCHALQELIVKMEEEYMYQDAGYIVTGDFNEDLMKGQKTISNLMSRNDYQQIITQATTLGNTLLDVIYVKNVNVRNSGIFQTHYSYHDAVYLQI